MSNDRPIIQLAEYVQEHSRQVPIASAEPGMPVVHFFAVEILGDPTREELTTLIRAALDDGHFCNLSVTDLELGQGYITLGAWIGDQGLALQLLGLGAAVGIWHVITPATLCVADEDLAARMAGDGYVLASGYYPQGVPA